MSLHRYKEYRSTSVQWLGELPSHWTTKPLWTLFRRTKRVGHEGEQLLSVYRDYGVIPKSSRDDNNNRASEDLAPYQLVMPGDLVINKMKAWQGSVGISEHRGIVSPAYFVYESTNHEDMRYLHYLMRSTRYITGYLSMSKGIRVNQWDLEPQYHSRMPVVLPQRIEQSGIATFLDRETAKIDELIAEQRHLIELLAKKRQATILHGVTKGLRPAISMKESRVEWIGDVPSHWSICRLGYCGRIENGSTPDRTNKEYWSGGEIPWLASSGVNQARVLEATDYITEQALRQCSLRILPRGAVIVGMIGQGKTRGMSAILELETTINQNLAAIVPGSKLLGEFLYLVFQAAYEFVREFGRGGNQAALNCEILSATMIPLPSTAEQLEIVGVLNKKISEIDNLSREAEKAIELLDERRTALIAAAVTGKLDVRGLVAASREAEVAA